MARENLACHGLDAGFALTDLHRVKVYIRHAEEVLAVREVCRAAFAPHAEARYLVVDLCRTDLLVEIEGVAARPRRQGRHSTRGDDAGVAAGLRDRRWYGEMLSFPVEKSRESRSNCLVQATASTRLVSVGSHC